jgi:Transglycosylase SLT domain
MRKILLALAITTALAFASVAGADNYGGVSYGHQQYIKGLVYQEFGHGWQAEAMIRCIRRESGFNERAANWGDSHGGSFGLAQINGVHDPSPGNYATKAWIQTMFDPRANLRQAHRLMGKGDLGPWGGSC